MDDPQAPITVDENGDIEVYATVEAACSDLEAIDVLAGEYEAFDSRGFRLRIDTLGQEASGMRIVPEASPAPEELTRRLRRFITRVGPERVEFDEFESAPVPELLDALLKFYRGY